MTALDLTTAEFQALASRVTSLAVELLRELPALPTFPAVTGQQTADRFNEPPPETGLGPAALDALRDVIALSRPPSPRFWGYVLGSGEPVAALADLLASLLNQNVTAWRSAPAAVAIEQQVVRWIAASLGCGDLRGALCGGGSAANLMALAMAREAKLPANESGARAGVVYASSEVHMSIPKTMALLGLGRANLRLLSTDERFRLSVPELQRAVAEDVANGRTPLAVVANVGTVSTGAIDPLPEIAALCQDCGLWLHVDGAYGALAAMATPEPFRALSAADSISLDAHKWLYQPVDCGLLLYRNADLARATFSFTGDYARAVGTTPLESFAFFDESPELSRRFRALKLWLSLRYHGFEAFRAAIRADMAHAQSLGAEVAQTPGLELLAPVSLSIVCFRYRHGGDESNLNELNTAILARLMQRGRVYLSNASIRGKFALRACFVNHRTNDADVREIVPEVLAAARELTASA
jgi:glutamate/tyrosine decarboxylase-like PLP-dependent enzyme